jgi:predicted glutamine amidotransferase
MMVAYTPQPPVIRQNGALHNVCMIAHRPVKGERGSNIPQQVIDTALVRHPDGFGAAWRTDEGLRYAKFAPNEKREFAQFLRDLDKHSGVEYVAHFRYATHGPEDQAHAHPYMYEDPQEGPVLVFHNGVIDIVTKADESDTEVFVRDVLARLPSAWWRDGALRYLVNGSIGWSKLVLMTETETVNLQETSGKWDGGLWYSSNHKPYAAVTPSTWVPRPYESTRAYTPTTQEQSDKAAVSTPATVTATTQSTVKRKAGKHKGSMRVVDRPYRFRHNGHDLTALKIIDRSRDGDYPEGIICDTCYTLGDVYVIDGGVYIDMAHKAPDGTQDDATEEEAYVSTTPVTSALVVA